MERIVSNMPMHESGKAETSFTNAVGATITVLKKANGKGMYQQKFFGRLCAHVVTGYEQWAIREACSIALELQVIIYDGLIASPGQGDAFTECIRCRAAEILGFPLELPMKESTLTGPRVLGDPDAEF